MELIELIVLMVLVFMGMHFMQMTRNGHNDETASNKKKKEDSEEDNTKVTREDLEEAVQRAVAAKVSKNDAMKRRLHDAENSLVQTDMRLKAFVQDLADLKELTQELRALQRMDSKEPSDTEEANETDKTLKEMKRDANILRLRMTKVEDDCKNAMRALEFQMTRLRQDQETLRDEQDKIREGQEKEKDFPKSSLGKNKMVESNSPIMEARMQDLLGMQETAKLRRLAVTLLRQAKEASSSSTGPKAASSSSTESTEPKHDPPAAQPQQQTIPPATQQQQQQQTVPPPTQQQQWTVPPPTQQQQWTTPPPTQQQQGTMPPPSKTKAPPPMPPPADPPAPWDQPTPPPTYPAGPWGTVPPPTTPMRDVLPPEVTSAQEPSSRQLQLQGARWWADALARSTDSSFLDRWMEDFGKKERKALASVGAIRKAKWPVHNSTAFKGRDGTEYADISNYWYARVLDRMFVLSDHLRNCNDATKGDIVEAGLGAVYLVLDESGKPDNNLRNETSDFQKQTLAVFRDQVEGHVKFLYCSRGVERHVKFLYVTLPMDAGRSHEVVKDHDPVYVAFMQRTSCPSGCGRLGARLDVGIPHGGPLAVGGFQGMEFVQRESRNRNKHGRRGIPRATDEEAWACTAGDVKFLLLYCSSTDEEAGPPGKWHIRDVKFLFIYVSAWTRRPPAQAWE
ncbi:hypothetical protein AK812_SmicGene38825 [Symbiodinium microadriaticum]|uniref:Uncharacterized protein n=1 Tax=Symbiodinium microadriaticum TaxID=2951 RepID=A0A1Q9CCR7_SYMMI|nr:hypothetical protein AK812_SmicGene38825 [Symbiodinium microadriaticum]